MQRSPTELTRLVPILVLLVAAGCGTDAPTGEPGPAVISLLDRWPEARVELPTPPPAAAPRAEIRFDGSGLEGVSWSVVQGVEDLKVDGGRLTGRATSEAPVILLETASPMGTGDELWAVEIALSASAGTRAGVHPVPAQGPPVPAIVARAGEWPLSSPLVPGDEVRTYSVVLDRVFTLVLPVGETDVTRVLVRPTDADAADFTVESVRLVFRREHLASIPSGPGWRGLGEVFRETLVSRAPEALSFTVTLPERPWLHLAVGTVEESPPTFRVEVAPAGGADAEVVAELEVEAPEAWQETRLDLAPWAGRTVELRLAAVADAAGVLAFWGAPTVRDAARGGERPQAVIVFLADTLRKDHLDAWGHERETAPTLSRLAAEGTRFADVVAQATWTKASVSSILTSLYPATTGVADVHDKVSAAETTLAEAFRGAGYATFATSSVPFTGQLTNLHQGVEVLYEFGAAAGAAAGNGSGRSVEDYRSKTAQVWVDAFLEWLDLHRDVPVFALIHVMDPHSPFRPKAPYDTTWAEPGGAERFAEQAARVEPHIESPLMRRFMAPSREELAAAGVDAASFVAHEKAWYDGSIRGMDAQLARLVARLGELGLAEDTVLAFVTDHGEEFLEHGRHWHGHTVYGELSNVPLVLWGRGVPAGRVVEDTVRNVDVMPTLLDLAGIEAPRRAQGRSLLRFMNGGAARPEPAFIEQRGAGPGEYDSFAIVTEGWKLIWNDGAPEGVPERELYDHEADPLDQNDVAAAHPDVVERLALDLERWRLWAESDRLDPDAATEGLSAAELERLRSLGYLE
jgi:arylsulfatase A-like enzyme